eukprot:4860361-Amphidinium_carterae.1
MRPLGTSTFFCGLPHPPPSSRDSISERRAVRTTGSNMESREPVLEAVRRSWRALRDVDEIWTSDHEVVLTAVQQHGHALQYATEALRADREIVLAAVQSSALAFQHATEALRADRNFALAAVQQENGHAL